MGIQKNFTYGLLAVYFFAEKVCLKIPHPTSCKKAEVLLRFFYFYHFLSSYLLLTE